ncbi:unnamed protein product [Orchesella dallaii]|uniref:RING-type domain-containing protein n=1 Tax=Orchesella dallaii TaxID=48710 RepID=A0ABP1PS75_9HEXA
MQANCPQCGVTYGILARYKMKVEVCGHLMCRQCLYEGGPCVQCPGPLYVPPTNRRADIYPSATANAASFPNGDTQRGVNLGAASTGHASGSDITITVLGSGAPSSAAPLVSRYKRSHPSNCPTVKDADENKHYIICRP